MAKTKSIFVCQSCGSQRSRWEGRCSDCGEWNTIVEELDSKPPSSGRGAFGGVHSGRVVSLKDAQNRETILKRISTGIGELDRVLGGGGLAYGSMVTASNGGFNSRHCDVREWRRKH
jgi:DNA repair protein RadA/Sms